MLARRHPRRTRLAGLALAASAATSCVVPAWPPEDPPDPVRVHLLVQGEHCGVVLPPTPTAEGWAEYAYGEWDWYSTGSGGLLDALAALTLGGDGALGRRLSDNPPESDPELQRRGARVQAFEASAERVAALRATLDRHWEEAASEPILAERTGLLVVPAPRRYALLHNCADATIAWLEALGCRIPVQGVVRGVRIVGGEAP